MSRTDDMVIRPALDAPDVTPAREEARERRLLEKTRRSRLLERVRQARRIKLARDALSGRSRGRTLNAARGARGARGPGGFVPGGAGRFARGRVAPRAGAATPVGLIVSALAIAAIVAARIITDVPFEAIGTGINKQVLGDLDERARAASAVRGRLAGDPNLARVVGQSGTMPMQVVKIGEDLLRFEKQRQDGRAAIEERFPVNGLADNVILRGVELWKAAWSSKDIPGKVAEARSRLDALAPERTKGTAR